MNSLISYSMVLLTINLAIFLNGAIAQSDIDPGLSNDTIADLNNRSIKSTNYTMINESIINESGPFEKISMNNSTFIISSDQQVDIKKSKIYNTTINPITLYPKRSIFMIQGYVHPTKDSIYSDRQVQNAEILSRAVEKTPHGYVTYHN